MKVIRQEIITSDLTDNQTNILNELLDRLNILNDRNKVKHQKYIDIKINKIKATIKFIIQNSKYFDSIELAPLDYEYYDLYSINKNGKEFIIELFQTFKNIKDYDYKISLNFRKKRILINYK